MTPEIDLRRPLTWWPGLLRAGYALAVALLIVHPLSGIGALIAQPPPASPPLVISSTADECAEAGGIWFDGTDPYCDTQPMWSEQTERYDQYQRLILVSGGAIAVVVSMLIIQSGATMAAGLLLGGIAALYKSNASFVSPTAAVEWPHVIALAILLAAILWQGQRYFQTRAATGS